MSKQPKEHAFSIELKSMEYVKLCVNSNESEVTVMLESFLGELEEVTLIEDRMLKIKGTNGILRMDLQAEELRTFLPFFIKGERIIFHQEEIYNE